MKDDIAFYNDRGLQDTDIPSIVTQLNQSPKVTHLYLQFNELTSTALESLSHLRYIIKIDLSHNNIVDPRALVKNFSFKEINLDSNNIDREGVELLNQISRERNVEISTKRNPGSIPSIRMR